VAGVDIVENKVEVSNIVGLCGKRKMLGAAADGL
jgi:hypothetical protein